MIAHKCDRCGVLYETYNIEDNAYEINAIFTKNRDDRGNGYSHGPFELCPACSKELVDWLYRFEKRED